MKRMLGAVLFSVVVFLCCIAELNDAYAEEWNRAGLSPLAMNLNLEENTGVMSVYWNGDYPLDYYENRWLDFTLTDDYAGTLITMELWLTKWRGVCTSPCDMVVEFITQNVNFVTE